MKKNNFTFFAALILVALAFASNISRAEAPASSNEDPIGSNFIAPELIMAHQTDIGLKEAQRQTIIDEMKKAQSNMIEIQFKLKAAMQEFASLLSATKIEEDKALSALQKVTKIENEMKTLHVSMMIRIKNALSKEQQEKIRKFTN